MSAGDSVDVTARSAPVPACVFGDDVYIKFEPEMDGNCQFNCLAEQLNAFGHGSLDANAVRSVIVSSLRDKARPEMMSISNFVPDCDIETYCNEMAKCGEYGDHITLQVAAHYYHIRILVLSSRGSAYDAIVTDTSCTSFESSSPIVLLGHYTEEEGTHYVGLAAKCEIDELLSSRLPRPVKITSIASVSRETVNAADGTTVVNTSTGVHEMHPEVESLVFKPLSDPTTVAGSTSFIDAQVVNDGIDQLSDRVASTSTSITPISQPHHITDIDNLPIHKSGKRTRKFCVDWYKQFPWLHWEGGCLLCYSCATANRQLGSTLSKRSEHAFVTTGYSCNWKKAVDNFAQHEKSVQHHESCEKLALIQDNVNVSHLLDKHHKEEQASARRALHAVVTTLLTLAHTGSAIRGHKMDDGNLMEWLNLRAQEIPELASFLQRTVAFISGDIQNELLSLMHNDVLRQIISAVNQSPYFAVIMDETTDISTKEQVSICLRYLKDCLTPVETFIGLYEVTSTTGENLCQVLMDVLCRCGLSIKCLRAQCYDGASNMSGAFRGVQARVKELQPLAVYVHCYAHSLNLVLQETARQVPIIRDSLEYLHRAAVLMGRSAKRKSILHAWSAAIKPICPTRWSVRAQAVTTALDHYEGILNALDEVATDSTNEASCVEASCLHAQFSNTQMFFCLLVAQAVFQPADRLSTALQSVKMTATSGLEAVKATHAMISSLRTDASFDKFIDKAMIAKNELRLEDMVQPRNRKPPKRIDSGAPACELTVTEYFRQQYFMVCSFISFRSFKIVASQFQRECSVYKTCT